MESTHPFTLYLSTGPHPGKMGFIAHREPSGQSAHSRHLGNPLNVASVGDFPNTVAKADRWVHGKVRDACGHGVGNCRVAANARWSLANRLCVEDAR